MLRGLTLPLLLAAVTACGRGGPTPTPAGPSPTAGSPSTSAGLSPTAGSPTPGGATASPGPPFDATQVTLGLEPVVGGMQAPLSIAHAGDGTGRIFVAQQGGQIRIIKGPTLVTRPFLDIADRITSGGERGLLGIAFHPRYPADPRIFVNYTDVNGDTRVSSFTVDPQDPDRANPASEVRFLFIKQPYANHNGGALTFGPDGYLYISTGDGGSGGDPQGNGQSLATMLGKILRIDIDRTEGQLAYAVPADNPFVGRAGAQPEIWLWGLRNPWRMSFDHANRNLWLGDVGQDLWEEVDVARSGQGGTNYGWNRMEGAHCFQPPQGCDQTGLAMPVAEYGHDQGCTIIGGAVYRGAAQPALAGGYVFADYCSGRLWAIDPARDGPQTPVLVLQSKATLSSFGEDEAGELYATDLSSGELLRVTASRR